VGAGTRSRIELAHQCCQMRGAGLLLEVLGLLRDAARPALMLAAPGSVRLTPDERLLLDFLQGMADTSCRAPGALLLTRIPPTLQRPLLELAAAYRCELDLAGLSMA
jgi:hypothetical protein